MNIQLFALLLLPLLAQVAFSQIPTAREIVLEAMRQRPTDPWPRGRGHVLLAVPGSEEMQKAYHEPGGSFSPVVRSFGLSIWITDSAGHILETSDSIPLAALKQRLLWTNATLVPTLVTTSL